MQHNRHLLPASIKPLALLLTIGLLASCHSPVRPPEPEPPPPAPRVATSGHLHDFGDPNLQQLGMRLRARSQPLHIIQLGDSHTAADFFTGALRNALQQAYGDAGPGLIPPAQIRGQRSAALQVSQANEPAWQLTSSRLQQASDFPLGGFILQPRQNGSRLTLSLPGHDTRSYQLRTLYRSSQPTQLMADDTPWPLPAHARWHWSAPISTQFPVSLSSPQANGLKLGGWLADNGQNGVMLSALGINGATLGMLDKWHPDWTQQLQALQPAMILLAYGTNEAFNDTLDLQDYQQRLDAHIQRLQSLNPQAVLLLIGPGDSQKTPAASSCQNRLPPHLQQVIDIQRKVAQQQRILFWDWHAQMGGPCGIEHWQARGLAAKDRVHLTRAGYEQSAHSLFADLKARLAQLNTP